MVNKSQKGEIYTYNKIYTPFVNVKKFYSFLNF